MHLQEAWRGLLHCGPGTMLSGDGDAEDVAKGMAIYSAPQSQEVVGELL